jgi:hypothetical protein
MARCFVTAALLMGLLSSGGCCWWCERHCPCAGMQSCAPPAGCAPACCPNTAYQPVYQPVAAPAPNFSQPHPPMHCDCTCNP